MKVGLAGLLIAALLLGGCAVTGSSAESEALVAEALARARELTAAGRDAEAGQLARAAQAVNPQAAGLAELGNVLAVQHLPSRRTTTQALQHFLPDRLLDLADVLAVELHAGYGVHAKVRLTHALPIGLGARLTWGLGWHERRSLGSSRQAEQSFVLFNLGSERQARVFDGYGSGAWANWSGDAWEPLEGRDDGDPFAVSATGTLLFVGADLGVHPLQLADFLTGWVGYDWLGDDGSLTQGLELSPRDEDVISELWNLAARRADFALFDGVTMTARPGAR